MAGGRWHALASEAVASFALVGVGCGAIMFAVQTGRLGLAELAAIWGLLVALLVVGVRGAHFNPAVTVGLAVAGKFAWRRVPGFVVAQSAGAFGAAAALRLAFGNVGGLGATLPAAGFGAVPTLAAEAVATAILMAVVLGVGGRRVGAAAAWIGATVAVLILAIGAQTGCSINPARSLGPALATGPSFHVFAYLSAPTAGAMVAAALHGVGSRAAARLRRTGRGHAVSRS